VVTRLRFFPFACSDSDLKSSIDCISRVLRDESLEESDNLPDPNVLAQEIVEDLEGALEQFREIAADLGADVLTERDQNDR
jgi:type I restriction enzyme M protein